MNVYKVYLGDSGTPLYALADGVDDAVRVVESVHMQGHAYQYKKINKVELVAENVIMRE